jgi:hypothetical protein
LSSFTWPNQGGAGGVPIYANLAAFPATATIGSLGVAADTGDLYEFNGVSWQLIAGPAFETAMTSIGTIDTGTPSANGAQDLTNQLILQSASATLPGLVNNATQSFSGQKTFTTGLTGTLTGAASLNVLTSALGNLTDAGTDGITVGNGSGATVGNVTLSQHVADTTHNGYLASADWNTFNGKQAAGSYITSLTGGVTASGPGAAAATVVTNANLTGPITSVGNATSIASQTGTGSTFVMNTGPTMTNPIVGTQSQGDTSTKAASTAYVDTAVANAVAGINPAVAVQAATTAAANTSGFTYNNGVSGVGATFTGTTNTAVVIDGFTFTALGQRLLVKNDTQSPSGAFNGIYYVTQLQTGILPPILTRALDYDTPTDINNTGAIPVVNGTVNGTTSWVETAQIVTVGTTPLVFVQFTANPANYLLAANNLSDVATKATAFNNISPMTTGGDLIYGGASGAGTRLANGTAGQVLQSNGTTLAPTWVTSASTNQSYVLQNLGLAASVGSSALTIALKQADGATDPSTGSAAVAVGYRSATATSGGFTLVNSTAALSIVVPIGASLGQTSAVNQYVWVYAINNAGATELAVSGVFLFPDNSIQSTTAIGAGSTSGSVLYSTTARTSVPIRLIGRMLVNETTAGTWASAPSDVVTAPSPVPNISDFSTYSITITSTSSSPTKGTITIDQAEWRRVGDSMEIRYQYLQSGAGSAGSGTYLFNLPSGFSANTSKITPDTAGNFSSQCGEFSAVQNGGVALIGTAFLYDTTHFSGVGTYSNTSAGAGFAPLGTTTIPLNSAAVGYGFSVLIPILGWSNYGP